MSNESTSIRGLGSRAAQFRAFNEQLNQRLGYEQQSVVRLQRKIDQLAADKEQLVKAVGLIDRCIQVLSASGLGVVESVTTAGLRLAFDDPTLGLIVEKKEGARGNSYGLLIRQGEVVGPATESFGGGVSNVAAFLLRVLLIKRFKLAKFIAFDESFNNVNGTKNKQNVSALLHKFCDEYGFTIFLVTGEELLTSAADRAYEVSMNSKGETVLKDLRDNLPDNEQDQRKDLHRKNGTDAASTLAESSIRS